MSTVAPGIRRASTSFGATVGDGTIAIKNIKVGFLLVNLPDQADSSQSRQSSLFTTSLWQNAPLESF